ncbi:nuclease-related domain-containing protein [Gryllotalpicola daejeonensis]|uniref:nuclease-related domain-containing protein n=1 Tax=Gryllotalpicola daejeonensis TaxID=993087 RepID=UPI0031D886A8
MGDETAGEHTDAQRVDFAGISALSSRAPGYAVALKCLEVQADAERLDPTLSTGDQVRLHPDAWSWYQGALGEIHVGKWLATLGPGWFVRHSVPIGSGTKDVDHLVIGPGGVFAINTKHHAGASVWVGDYVLRVNGGNTSHLKAGRGDAADVSRRLSAVVGFPVPVTPVIAVVNASSISDRRPGHNRPVQVVDASRIVAWIRSQPAHLSPAKIELVKLAAEEPGTWHVDPHAADTFRVMQRFERLVDRVSTASAERARPRTAGAAGRAARLPRPTRASRPHLSRPRRPASTSRSARKGATAEKNVAQIWLLGALFFGAVIYGTHAADRCSAASAATHTGVECAVVEALIPLYPVGWWIAGGTLLLALIATVVYARRP